MPQRMNLIYTGYKIKVIIGIKDVSQNKNLWWINIREDFFMGQP